MTTAYLITLWTMGGLACAFVGLPAGIALAAGAATTVLLMFAMTTLVGMSVTATAWTVAIIAAMGWAFGVRRAFPVRPSAAPLAHPALLLSALCAAIFAFAAPDAPYLPHAWDEMSGWATWMKQILAADVWYSDAMMDGFPHYPKGWPLIAIYPQVFMSGFDGSRSIAVATVLHIAVLAALFDMIRALPAIRTAPGPTRTIAAWGIVLVLILVEATWKAIPVSLEVERPILYATVALFAVGMYGHVSERTNGMPWLALAAILAATVSMKTSMVSAFVPALVFLAASEGSPRRRLVRTVAVVLPALTVVLGWSLIGKPPVPSGDGLTMAPLGETLAGFARTALGYVTTYKAPVVAIATLGFAWALLRDRKMWILPAAWAAFTGVYMIGLIFLYLYVMHPNAVEAYPSLQRYIRLPVRLYHVFGCILFLHEAFRLISAQWPRLIGSRAARGLATVACLALAGWIYAHAARDVADLDTKAGEDQRNIGRTLQIRDEAAALNAMIETRGLRTPMVAIVAQGDDGFWHNVAGYYSVDTARTGPVQLYRHLRGWSWGPTHANTWMSATTPDDLIALFKTTDVIWPFVVDDWMKSVLARLADSPDCAARPTRYFLFRDETAPTGFGCVLKK